MTAAFQVTHVSKRFGTLLANDDISLTIDEGDIFGLFGPNGAGKTTLVRQLVGLLKPTAGSVTMFGEPVDGGAPSQYVAFLGQQPHFFDPLTVREALDTAGTLRGLSGPARASQSADLLERFHLTKDRDTIIRRLSGGQQHLVSFMVTLMGARPVLVLDEPTNELDPLNRRRVWEMLAELNRGGTTILLVTHNLLEAEQVVRNLAIINKGRVQAAGAIAELKARADHRVRLELHFRPQTAVASFEQALQALGPGNWVAQGRYHVLIESDQADGAVSHVIARIGCQNLNDFRVLAPSLEDVYIQVEGGNGSG